MCVPKKVMEFAELTDMSMPMSVSVCVREIVRNILMEGVRWRRVVLGVRAFWNLFVANQTKLMIIYVIFSVLKIDLKKKENVM